jgi:hypothetical protein
VFEGLEEQEMGKYKEKHNHSSLRTFLNALKEAQE